ncbi:MAG: hypothetical protein IJL76_02870 [Bacilli bacterium]|nr:hypothetical protein [Bacilli bacterium]
MIIDGNNFNSNQNKFQDKMNTIKENGELYKDNTVNPFVEDVNSMEYANALDTKNMKNKSLSMLNERLKAGLITTEEFHREVDKLNKK